jgi:hypothetical protein
MDPIGLYASYLMRIWMDDQAGGSCLLPAWHWEVIHIQTGQKVKAKDKEHILQFIQEQLQSMYSKSVNTLPPDGIDEND